MKLRFLLLILLPIILISCSEEQKYEGTFSFLPLYPSPGEEITVRYVPDSTKLAEKNEIELAAYFYNNDLIDAYSTDMQKKPDGWFGKIRIPENAYGVIIKFTSDDTEDNNSSKGYVINLYEGETIIAGSKAGYATAGLKWGKNILNLELDGTEALQLFSEELKDNPNLKSDFISPYLSSLLRSFPEKTDSILEVELNSLENKKDLSESELQYLASRFLIPPFEDSSKHKKYMDVLYTEFPENELVQNEEYNKIYKEQDMAKKLLMLQEFETKYPKTDFLPYLYFSVGGKYMEEKNIDSILAFGKMYQYKVHPAFFNRSVNNLIDVKKMDYEKLLSLSQLGVEAAKRQLNNPFMKKQKFETNKEFEKNNNYFLAINLYANAVVLDKLNRNEEALPLLEEAVNASEETDPAINNFLISNLFKIKDYDNLKARVEKFISRGKATSEMKDYLKQAYIVRNGSETGFAGYVAKFENEAKASLFEKLKKKMITETAPDFTLKDLKGKNVSLSSLKGKTIIIDFWATWCGPCINSFPALQQSVDNYKDNKNVEFLFINTWERVEDKKQNAEDFITKNNYTFKVLLDDENKVVESYNVSGIPTKFIVDREGNIRFKSVGYSGNNDELIEELETMITLVN